MKLIQFVYPMFLVALGLHAAVLFVPIGGTSEEVVEDVDLAELSETEAPAETLFGQLPVPDPNVPTDSGKVARSGANGASQPATNSAKAGAGQQRATAASSQPADPQASPDPSPSPAEETSESPADQAPTDDGNLPNLPADSSQVAEENSSADSNSNQAAEESSFAASARGNSPQPPASDLIVSANVDLSPSLQTMVAGVTEALIYREEGTSEAIAKLKRDTWQAKIRAQANIDTIENIAPTQVTGLTQVSYPIKSADDTEVLLYSLCLEKDPHDAEVGVLFDSQGNVVGQPELIRSTGYGALNEKILATFTDVDNFSNHSEAIALENRRSKAYTVEVVVDYKTDDCVSLEKLQLPTENSDG